MQGIDTTQDFAAMVSGPVNEQHGTEARSVYAQMCEHAIELCEHVNDVTGHVMRCAAG